MIFTFYKNKFDLCRKSMLIPSVNYTQLENNKNLKTLLYILSLFDFTHTLLPPNEYYKQ